MNSTDGLPRMLLCGGAHPALARHLASELDLSLVERTVESFADGETHVEITDDVRGAELLLVQPLSPPVNDHLIALALLADAARAAGARRLIAVIPYLGYSRQEQRKRAGDPRSAQVIARLLASVGIDHLVTVDLHAPALESAFSMPVTLAPAETVLLPAIRRWDLHAPVIVSPDAGGLKRAQRVALQLGAPLAGVAKLRSGIDQPIALQLMGDVRGRSCLIIDDMASTGRTVVNAAELLQRTGARDMHAAFTHAVLSPGALERITAAGFQHILTTDSIPPPRHERLEVTSIASTLADVLSRL